MEDVRIIEAMSKLALNELCSYIDTDGNPVICDWEAYDAICSNELARFRLDRTEFDAVKGFLEKAYEGKL